MNSFGKLFRVSLFGESHGSSVGVVVDGVTPGIALTEDDFHADLDRRRSGRKGTTPRTEPDRPKLMSGVVDGHTTGAPLMVLFENTNTRSRDYSRFREQPRPGQADYNAHMKYSGFNDIRGGGHFSGRITLGLVAAGVIAKKMIAPTTMTAEVLQIGGTTDVDAIIDEVVEKEDSVGGLVQCVGTNMPKNLGEPYFDKYEAMLAHMIFALPAVRAFEVGSGIKASSMRGSEHNDSIIDASGKTATNNGGGVNGGITSGNDLVFRVTFKPTPSIASPQNTFNFKNGKVEELIVEGRHDACLTLRTPAVVEACAAIVTADLLLTNKMYPQKEHYYES